MHTMNNFAYVEQRFFAKIDLLNKGLVGVSELILAPLYSEAEVIRLHCRQLKVKKITIDGFEASFEHLCFLDKIVDEQYRDLGAFDLFYRGAIVASKEGELIIQVPSQLQFTRMKNVNSEGSSTKPDLSKKKWDLDDIPVSHTGFCPIRVRIEYELHDPAGGLRFVLPDNYNLNRSPHMYTYCGPFGGLCDGTRLWMPCIDTLQNRCPFRIELTVPAWCVAVCSGHLIEQAIEPCGKLRTFRYVLQTPTNSSSVGFAVGPFKMFVPEKMPKMTHFCLPEYFDYLKYTAKKTEDCYHFFEDYFKTKYPFENYQQVYVEDPPDELHYMAGLSILDQRILHGPAEVDRELPSHLIQVKGFVGSWIGGAIGIEITKDAWVLIGLVGYLVNIYIYEKFGEEEYGFRILLSMDALTTRELLHKEQSPAFTMDEVDVYAEYAPSCLPFLEIKAPLVIHMIEQRITRNKLKLAIQKVMSPGGSGIDGNCNPNNNQSNAGPSDGKQSQDSNPEDNDAAPTRKLLNDEFELLTTKSFLRVAKEIAGSTGQDLTKSFLTAWILNSGMPFFTVGYWYNRKQTQAEIVIQRELPLGFKQPAGNITVSIVEDKEHAYPRRIDQDRHKWDFPCHSKVRKKRRKRQALDEPDDSVVVSGPGMGLNDTPVYWVKVDSEYAWLRHVVMHQPDFNWMEQLLSDKKVSSRVEAVRALAIFPLPHEKKNVMACRAITECMSGLTTHSRRLRKEAALSLAIWQSIHAPLTNANTNLPIWKGMHNLIRIFKTHFFDLNTDMPLPNYFLSSGGKVELEGTISNGLVVEQVEACISGKIQIEEYAAGEYEIKKAIPQALSFIRSQSGFSPSELEEFLLQLLTENDNSKNYITMADKSQVVEDCYYIGIIVLSLSSLTLETNRPHPMSGSVDDTIKDKKKKRTVDEILRYLHYDGIKPSYQRIITVCCLEALCNMKLAGRCDAEIPYFSYVSNSYPTVVRKAAIESIVRLYLAENPNTPNSFNQKNNLSANYEINGYLSGEILDNNNSSQAKGELFGPVAAFAWITNLLLTESSPSIRIFCVQALLDGCKGYPPRVAVEVLSTFEPGSYTLKIRDTIRSLCPSAFLKKSPFTMDMNKFFTKPDLSQLHNQNLKITRIIVEKLWLLLNEKTAYDQRLRVALIELYRTVWGDSTPLCVATYVTEKSRNWAGGYELLRLMIEESKEKKKNMFTGNQNVSHSMRNPSDDILGHGRNINIDNGGFNTMLDKRAFNETAYGFDPSRVKKLKFKVGDPGNRMGM